MKIKQVWLRKKKLQFITTEVYNCFNLIKKKNFETTWKMFELERFSCILLE